MFEHQEDYLYYHYILYKLVCRLLVPSFRNEQSMFHFYQPSLLTAG